jgi:hypothetical protein
MTTKPTRARQILDSFVRSEYFANWSADHVEAGSYSRNEDRRDRFERCHDAAEDGSDGSTHAERLQDMREALGDWLRDRRRASKLHFAEFPYRVETAVLAEIDAIELWHETNGSLFSEVG